MYLILYFYLKGKEGLAADQEFELLRIFELLQFLRAPIVVLDSDGEVIVEEVTTFLSQGAEQDLTLLQTMGATMYILDSIQNRLIWTNMDGLQEYDSSYTDRNADSTQEVFNVRLDPSIQIRGYKDIPLMEDIEICNRLKNLYLPEIHHGKSISSSRRWKAHGFFRTILLMRILRPQYSH